MDAHRKRGISNQGHEAADMTSAISPAAALRARYPVTASETFLNHASVGPISTRVMAAMQAQMMRHVNDPFNMMPSNRELYAEGRQRAARLVGTLPASIAYIQNTSHGISLIANGLGLGTGDNVVISAAEFPSNTLPWLRLEAEGVGIRRVTPDAGRMTPDAVRPAIDANTRVVALSHVQYWNGYRCDLAALATLCREHDVLLVVDGTQSIGAMRLDMAAAGVDALVVSSHKWMLGPLGIGFMALAPRALERVRVTVPGWLAVNEPFAFRNTLDYLPDARRFEPGTENSGGICGLVERLREIDEYGADAIEDRVLGLITTFAEAVQRIGANVDLRSHAREQSGILTFRLHGADNAAAVRHLVARKVRVTLRNASIRVSPHYYNDETDIAALLEGLRSFTR
jgi:cysteine desulfurase / selenocysteine lyase